MSFLSRALLVALLVTQAVLMAAGSSLVYCVETGSTLRFELLSGVCCESPDGASPLDGHEVGHGADGEDCGDCQGAKECSDCEDQVLLFAPVERHACPVPAPALSVWFSNVQGRRAAISSVPGRQGQLARWRGPSLGALRCAALAVVVIRC
mgnify:CR=1 FL=1|jgi:hypothetical protein